MATYRLKKWFLTITGTANKAGTRFKDGDKPNESTFSDWFKSSLFKSEPDDRAKEDVAGTTLADINGHVVAATDAQAKANQAKKEDRTVVAQASQLPTNEAGDTEAMSFVSLNGVYNDVNNDYEDVVLKVEASATLSRNQYVHNWSSSFKGWFNSVLSTITDFSAKLKDLNTRVSNNSGLIAGLTPPPGTGWDAQLPVGSTTFHLSHYYVTDPVWRVADGLSSVTKWIDVNDQGLGPSVIFAMLSEYYNLETDPNDANFFLLPNLSNRVAMMSLNRGLNDSSVVNRPLDWGGKITKAHLPRHQHTEDLGYGGDLMASEFGSEHEHVLPWGGVGSGTGVASSAGGDTIGTNTVNGDNRHTHGVGGSTGTHDSTWGANNNFTFTPPNIGGGWLIKVI